MARVVVIGAGIIGCACAYYLARDGHDVTVLERSQVGSGTTSRGEGNILVSDKAPGPELDLARYSQRLWRGLAADLGAEALEWEPKGGLVVATDEPSAAGLADFAARQSAVGVECEPVASGALADYEPHLRTGLPHGVWYPDDQQVQPVRAAAALMRAAAAFGAVVRPRARVTGLRRSVDGRVSGVEYVAGTAHRDDVGHVDDAARRDDATRRLDADHVVNAAGTWGGEVSELFGAPIPVLPRRGFVLVTEPLPRVVRHKVYTAEYVANVASADAGLETSVVIEGTRGGTVLIGASRERVGFDATVDYDVVRVLATKACHLFPILSDVSLMRVYRGFRPYCPDHLPVIGADPRCPGLWHACGHEGAGIGLAPATGALLAALLGGHPTPVSAQFFSPARFAPQEMP